MMNLKTWTPNEYSIDNARNNRVDAVIYTNRISVDVQITRCVKKETALRRLWKTLEANDMTGGLTLVDALSMLSDTNEYHDGCYRLGAEYDPEIGWNVWYCYKVEDSTEEQEEQPTENTAENAEQSAQPATEQEEQAMKTNIDIMEYSKRLFAADLFAAIVLEEDFDPACDYTWSAAGEDWADEFRAELNGYISAGCCAERAADYRKALTILDEMEQAAAEQPQTSTPDYTALTAALTAELNARHDRSAWDKAVTLYALDLLDDIQSHADNMERLPIDGAELERWALNGADNWSHYSTGACSLVWSGDIAARVCTPSMYKRKHEGASEPGNGRTWLDVQADALKQACNRLRKICRSNGLYCKGVQ